jgi:hypothetical protein
MQTVAKVDKGITLSNWMKREAFKLKETKAESDYYSDDDFAI